MLGQRLKTTGASQNHMRDARNQVQGEWLLASINRCNVYKTHLRRMTSNTNFLLGSAAIGLAGAGTIVSGGASRVLAGLSTIVAGTNAEFEKDFVGNLMTSVIIPGIDKQRSLLLNDIASKRCRSVTDYPLTFAIAEALRFHGACSADVGIAAPGQARACWSAICCNSAIIAPTSTTTRPPAGAPRPRGAAR